MKEEEKYVETLVMLHIGSFSFIDTPRHLLGFDHIL